MKPSHQFLSALERLGLRASALRQVEARRLVWSRDASHYQIAPSITLRANSVSEISKILSVASEQRLPVTFRSGGSSLSGQTLGTGLVLDTRSSFQRIVTIKPDSVIAEAGVTLARLNAHLSRIQKRLGPDPASMIASTLGGAVSNNSSGMTCGTRHNSYATIRSAKIVFADGAVINTADIDADRQLRLLQPAVYRALKAEHQWLANRPDLTDEIKRQFSLKNTMGYSLNALVDYSSPIEMLLHLLVGSEGTLAFMAEIELATLPVLPLKAVSLLIFESLESANNALAGIMKYEPTAIELMDETSLRALEDSGNLPNEISRRLSPGAAALLIEFEAANESNLEIQTTGFAKDFGHLATMLNIRDAKERNQIWALRKGLYAIVAKSRPVGTTAILEDVVVPPDRLAEACNQIATSCQRYGYETPVIFGHVRDGNIHFMIADDFSDPERVFAFGRFTEEIVDLVLALGGNLKAEHGTGRAMAPFVARQFGDELFQLIKRLKLAFDPNLILNPGVIVTDSQTEYLENLKTTAPVSELVDACVECGYCESSCPSAGLTLTPRERIVAFRELAALPNGSRAARTLKNELIWQADATCATDGMCAVNCPVSINTGDFVKQLRSQSHRLLSNRLAQAAANNWAAVTRVARVGLKLAARTPALASTASRLVRQITPPASFPLWKPVIRSKGFSRGRTFESAADQSLSNSNRTRFLYLPSCMNELFGDESIAQLIEMSKEAGLSIVVPSDISGFCCGTPFSSKGFSIVADQQSNRNRSLVTEYPGHTVVIDGSSCHSTLAMQLVGDDTEVIELGEFLAKTLLSKLPVRRKHQKLVLHPTCSGEKSAVNSAMLSIAEAIADEVVVPIDWRCCGYAGDRGMLAPELTANATALEAAEVNSSSGSYHVSNNQPCQIALSSATGVEYRSIIEAWLWSVK